MHGVLSRERTRLSDLGVSERYLERYLERLGAHRRYSEPSLGIGSEPSRGIGSETEGTPRCPAARATWLRRLWPRCSRPGDGLPTTRVSATLATIAGAIGDASDPRGPPIAALSPRTVTGDAGAGAARDVLGREGTTGAAERGLDDRVGAARAEFGLRAVPLDASSVPAPTAGPWPVVCHLSLCARITSFAVLDSFANALAAMHASEAAATPAGPLQPDVPERLSHGLRCLDQQVGELDGIAEAVEPRLRHQHHGAPPRVNNLTGVFVARRSHAWGERLRSRGHTQTDHGERFERVRAMDLLE